MNRENSSESESVNSVNRPSIRALHLVVGPPAAGKTTFGQELAQQRGGAFLDIDTCTETLVRAAQVALAEDPDDRDSRTFKRRFRDPIYQTLFDIARANLPHIDVVATGPFTREFANPHWLDEVARSLRVPCQVEAYYVHASERKRYERMKRRGNPRDHSKLADWESFLRYYGDQKPPLFPHVTIET